MDETLRDVEQDMSDFFSVMPLADSVSRAEGMKGFLAGLKHSPRLAPLIPKVAELTSTYLYEPESPVFDPESFLSASDAILEMVRGEIGEAAALRLGANREQASKNRPGQAAADFIFIDRSGKKKSLRETFSPEAETLLIFYDLDCHDCHVYMDTVASDAATMAKVARGGLHIVAIEAYGADPHRWRQDADRLPASWTVGRSPDGEIDSEEIYSLLRAPTVYILNTDGTVSARIKN